MLTLSMMLDVTSMSRFGAYPSAYSLSIKSTKNRGYRFLAIGLQHRASYWSVGSVVVFPEFEPPLRLFIETNATIVV